MKATRTGKQVFMENPARMLVAYDISRAARARKARNILRGYADSAQKSVFECALSVSRQKELLRALEPTMDHQDHWVWVTVDPRARIVRLGTGGTPSLLSYWG